MKCPVILCVLVFGFVACARANLELKMLHVLFRHGDKVPHAEFQNYPNDPHRNHSYEPIGNGGLTNEGKMREYTIGRMLRERYDQYFGPEYWPSMIYGRSTEYARTQMSLQLVLAGLFPPTERQTWNKRLPWIPAAVMPGIPYDQDNLLFPHYCPRYREAYGRFLRQADVREMINKYSNVMAYLTEHTGKKIDTTSAVYYLYNLLKEEASQGLTLPKWTGKVFPSPMKEITALDFNLRSYTKELKKLNGGLYLRKITDDIKEIRAGTLRPSDRKAFLYSAHELNVAALVRTLGTNDPVLPAYGSAVIFETLRDKNEMYYVRVLMWTGVTERLITQTIPGCTEICPLDEFMRLMKDVIPNDADYYCYGIESKKKDEENAGYANRNYWPISFALALLVLVLQRHV